MSDKGNHDKLPPHSIEAEQGALGCCLLAPLETIPVARKRLKDVEGLEFYDLRHREIWLTLGRMFDDRIAGKPICSNDAQSGIDLITVQQRLKDVGRLEDVGGLAYLAELPDKVPSAANLEHYLIILIEQFAARELLRTCTDTASRALQFPGQIDHLLSTLQHDFDRIAALRVTEGDVPQRLKAAGAWGEEVWNEFMGIHCNEEQGWTLPIEFKFRVRLQECTLFTGDDGSGKSTFLNYAALHLANQGARTLIASFEMPPKKTLRMLITQLVGTREFPDSNAGHALFRKALAWINSRFYIYDFLGIGDWRDVLSTFRYAAEHLGVNVFILDSVMRIGIADDDYGAQGLAAAQFAQFAQAAGVHLFLVIHENKGSEGKAKVRGSKLWTANADNIVKIERNQDKGIKLDELWADIVAERASKAPDQGFIDQTTKKMDELREKWDARAVLLKQRDMGSQQNAAKYFYYDGRCFQYREHRSDAAVNWMSRWGKKTELQNEQKGGE
jgi:energy-coupling factor transporter ATP-binding protein EcfA2